MKIKKNNKLLYISNLAWKHNDLNRVIELIRKHNFTGMDIAPLQINNKWKNIEKKIVNLSKKLKINKIKVNAIQGIFYKTNFNLFKDYDENFKEIYKHFLLIIRISKILKCKKIIIGSSDFRRKGKLNSNSADIIFLNFFKKLKKILIKNNIYICLETIPFKYGEDYLYNFNHLLKLVKQLKCKWIKINFDTSLYHFDKFNKNIFIKNLKFIKNIQITEKNFKYLKKSSIKNIFFSNLINKKKNIKDVSLEIVSKKTNLKKLNTSMLRFSKLLKI